MRRRSARTRTSLRFLRSPLPFIGVATAVAIGTGVAAYGDWDVSADSASFVVHADRIPKMAAPTAELPSGPAEITEDGLVAQGPRIRWDEVEIAPGTPVQRYVVTRHLGPIAQVACDVPAGRTRCVDESAPAGYLATYTVAAAYGSFWTGVSSKPSEPMLLPGEAAPILVDGVFVVPGAGGTAVVPEPGVAASAPATVVVPPDSAPGPAGDPGGSGEPDDDAGPGEPEPAGSASHAPVYVPPAPPEDESEESTTEPSSTEPDNAPENEDDTQKGTPAGAILEEVIGTD